MPRDDHYRSDFWLFNRFAVNWKTTLGCGTFSVRAFAYIPYPFSFVSFSQARRQKRAISSFLRQRFLLLVRCLCSCDCISTSFAYAGDTTLPPPPAGRCPSASLSSLASFGICSPSFYCVGAEFTPPPPPAQTGNSVF